MNMIFRYVAVFLFLPVGIFISRADEDALIASGAMSFAQAVYPYEMFLSLYGKDTNTVDSVSEGHYQSFLALTAEHYRERFSASELEEVSAFLTSPVGRKWYERDETEFTLFESHLKNFHRKNPVWHIVGLGLGIIVLTLARYSVSFRKSGNQIHWSFLGAFTIVYAIMSICQNRSLFGNLSSVMEDIMTVMTGIGQGVLLCIGLNAWSRRKQAVISVENQGKAEPSP